MSRFETIASFRDLPIAELAKSKLESEGIPCTLLGKHHIGMNWLYSQAIGGVKVQVRAEDSKLAKQILNTDESASLSDIDVGSPKEEKCCVCKRCGSTNISLIKNSRKAGALSLLFGLPLIFFGTKYKCKECGYNFKAKNT